MTKFHINPSTGGISRCRATTQQCPFGGESGRENHFESISEAKTHFEQMMASKQFPVITRVHDPIISEPTLADVVRDQINTLAKEWEKLDSRIREEEKRNYAVKLTENWYRAIQRRKDLWFKKAHLEQTELTLLPPEIAAEKIKAAETERKRLIANREAWFAKQDARNGPFNFHPPIEGNVTRDAYKAITAFTGKSQETIENEVEGLIAVGLTQTEAFRAVWNTSPLRTDKPLVAVDLEVASPMIKGRVDTGPYSNIIEVGWVKRWPDGKIEEGSYLCGIPEDFAAVEGTGAEHIHNISPEMVAGLPTFVRDEEKLVKLRDVLTGSVMVAHSARYETSQFKHNLPGFASMLDRGIVEVLDTQQVTRLFVPTTEANSNKNLVEATGGVYEGAHRALEDAKMTLIALLTLKGVSQ